MTAEPELAQILSDIDRFVDEWTWHEQLSVVPMRVLTVAGYRRELKAYTIGEIAAGRYGVERAERPPY